MLDEKIDKVASLKINHILYYYTILYIKYNKTCLAFYEMGMELGIHPSSLLLIERSLKTTAIAKFH